MNLLPDIRVKQIFLPFYAAHIRTERQKFLIYNREYRYILLQKPDNKFINILPVSCTNLMNDLRKEIFGRMKDFCGTRS